MIQFAIADWFYWGEHFFSQDCPEPVADKAPALDNVPAIQRRRLPLVAKRINAFALAAGQAQTPLVYASCHGSMSNTFDIIRQLDSDVSPMKFSLSVHNAIAGLLSVVHQNTQSYQVIDSLSGNIEIALIEAVALLTEYPRVNVIYYDEQLPPAFSDFSRPDEPSATCVLALTLTAGKAFSLEKQSGLASDYHLTDKTAARRVADWLRQPTQPTLTNCYADAQWQWQLTTPTLAR